MVFPKGLKLGVYNARKGKRKEIGNVGWAQCQHPTSSALK